MTCSDLAMNLFELNVSSCLGRMGNNFRDIFGVELGLRLIVHNNNNNNNNNNRYTPRQSRTGVKERLQPCLCFSLWAFMACYRQKSVFYMGTRRTVRKVIQCET
jgi:hypothetical protein